MNTADLIAQALLESGAVKISMNPPFTWTSGIRSPIYCDNRKLISYPQARAQIVKAFVEKIKAMPVQPDFVGGTATAAIPWAAFVAYEMGIPMVYIRPEKKEHGAGRQVEGDLPPNKRVLIVEDLISTGGSSVKAAQAVRDECQGTVTDVLSIVTYELGEAQKNFEAAGLTTSSLTNYTTIVTKAVERGAITQEQHALVTDFKADPRTWATRHNI